MKAFLVLSLILVACGGRANGDSHSVYCVTSETKPEYTQALIDATQEWNDKAGTELTVSIGDCPNKPGSTYMVIAGGTDKGASGSTYYQFGNDPNEIHYVGDRTPEETRTDFLHEIGHSLGLKHLPDQKAIMFQSVNDAMHLTDNDIQAYWNSR